MAVFLVNRYLDQPLAVDVAFEGIEPPSSGRLRELAAESPFARNDFEQPDRLRIEERPVSSVARLELPPHSVSVLVLS